MNVFLKFLTLDLRFGSSISCYKNAQTCCSVRIKAQPGERVWPSRGPLCFHECVCGTSQCRHFTGNSCSTGWRSPFGGERDAVSGDRPLEQHRPGPGSQEKTLLLSGAYDLHGSHPLWLQETWAHIRIPGCQRQRVTGLAVLSSNRNHGCLLFFYSYCPVAPSPTHILLFYFVIEHCCKPYQILFLEYNRLSISDNKPFNVYTLD